MIYRSSNRRSLISNYVFQRFRFQPNNTLSENAVPTSFSTTKCIGRKRCVDSATTTEFLCLASASFR